MRSEVVGSTYAFHQRFDSILCIRPCSSLSEMEKWMEDIEMAVEMAKFNNGSCSDLMSCKLTDSSKLTRTTNIDKDFFLFFFFSSVDRRMCDVRGILNNQSSL